MISYYVINDSTHYQILDYKQTIYLSVNRDGMEWRQRVLRLDSSHNKHCNKALLFSFHAVAILSYFLWWSSIQIKKSHDIVRTRCTLAISADWLNEKIAVSATAAGTRTEDKLDDLAGLGNLTNAAKSLLSCLSIHE